MIDFERIARGPLRGEPFEWAEIGGLFAAADAEALAATYPHDHYKLVSGYGGEKDYEYEARPLIVMNATAVSYREQLSEAWQRLADDLLSRDYRQAVSTLTGLDLSDAQLEVNAFHYGPGASLGAHPDLPDKVVTHVLYFNRTWNNADGGCLQILRSNDPRDRAAEIAPLAGNSAVLVRSDRSWHAVAPVVKKTRESRRSVTATFYRPGSVSSMWPPGETPLLRDYRPPRGWLWFSR